MVEDAASVVPPEVDISVELVSFERATVTALIRFVKYGTANDETEAVGGETGERPGDTGEGERQVGRGK